MTPPDPAPPAPDAPAPDAAPMRVRRRALPDGREILFYDFGGEGGAVDGGAP